MAVASYAELKEFKGRIKELCHSTETCLEIFNQVYHQYKFVNVDGLKNLIGKIGQTNFKVIVIGKFSTGKSSLINSLLGDLVLPDSLSPCTAYINEIVYGEEKQATIYFKHPLPEQWADFVQNEAVKEHIAKHCAAGPVPEFVIPLEDLEDCVTIPWDEDEEDVFEDTNHLNISPFEKAVIQYPCELCRNGIEIIDSPGLDESQDRTEIVDQYLNKVDAVIYVMTNVATGGDSDKEIIEQYLTQNDIKNVFFVCNLFGIPLKKAQKQLFGRLKKVFGEKTLLGERGIHLVNIRDMANTGVGDFEAALADYLNKEKGKAQLTSYVEQLTKLDKAIIEDSQAFECVNDVKLADMDQKIAFTKELIAEDKTLLAQAQELIAEAKEIIDTYCKREVTERFKKNDYTIRADIRDRADAATELPNAAMEADADVMAKALTEEYLTRFDADFKAYTYEELTKETAAEIAETMVVLQEKVNAVAANVARQEFEGNGEAFAALTSLKELISQGYANALAMDITPYASFGPLGLGNVLDKIVKDTFVVYALYQNDNRGTKLTQEIQNNVSLDIYKRLERTKRPVVDYTIRQLLIALDEVVFHNLISSMEQAIAIQEAKLAERETERLVILAKQAAEHAQAAAVLADLENNLQTLTTIQAEIDA